MNRVRFDTHLDRVVQSTHESLEGLGASLKQNGAGRDKVQ